MSTASDPFRLPSPVQEITHSLFLENGLEVFIKRDDLIHPIVSGNKWRKLKYNLVGFQASSKTGILTVGGPYSNHLVAAAEVCFQKQIPLKAIIRGEEVSNLSLDYCREKGMQCEFVSRAVYREIREIGLSEHLLQTYADDYFIPEGGSNLEGIHGCQEILEETKDNYDCIFCPIGSGTTICGLISGPKRGLIVGVSVMKHEQISEDLKEQLLEHHLSEKNPWYVLKDAHCGGFAKVTPELMDFTKSFKIETGIQLDYIYTAKMMLAFFKMIRNNLILKGSKVLLIHTGGLQGNASIEAAFN